MGTLDAAAFLRRNFGTWTNERLAERLGCTADEVAVAARELGLAKSKRVFERDTPRWTERELEQLRALYPSQPNLAIARELGKSVKSIGAKAARLGLRKTQERRREMGAQNIALRRDRRARS